MSVIVITLNGTEQRLDLVEGQSLMETIRGAGLSIPALCGGCCGCATCQVYVDPDWVERLPPKASDESDMLDMADEVRPESRLSCQIILTDAMRGLRVTLAASNEF